MAIEFFDKLLMYFSLFLCVIINIIGIYCKLKSSKKNIFINCYLLFASLILYLQNANSYQFSKMFGIIIISYCSIIIFFNRKFKFSNTINIFLYGPFLVGSIYFLLKLINF